MKTIKAQKAELTREINALTAHINDLKEMQEKQGERHFFKTSGGYVVKRWMYFGDFFFNETVANCILELNYLKYKREKLNNINQ